MLKEKKLNLLGQLLLFTATIAWGSSFFILKETIAEVPALYVIGVRFLCSSVVLLAVFYKKLKKMTAKVFLHGTILGLTLCFAYITQTFGLKYTTPSRNSFVTCLYCVLTPFLVFFINGRKLSYGNIISAVLATVGMGFIVLSGGQEEGANVLLGDGLTFISAIFYALQVVVIDKFEKDDSATLLCIELLVVGVVVSLFSAIFELPKYGIGAFKLNGDQILRIGYLTVFCTLYAQLAFIFGEKYTSASQTALIGSFEAVFATLFSVLFADEKLTLMLVIGFIAVFIAIVNSEVKIELFRNKKKNKDKA